MADPNPAPHTELNPATAHIAATHEDKDDHKPRDSKGWDGKLRVDKQVVVKYPADPNAGTQSDAEESEDEGPPPDEIQADEDLLDDVPDDEDEIELVHCKVGDMASLRLERFKQMKVELVNSYSYTFANHCSVSAYAKTVYNRSKSRTMPLRH